jgi:hypothetical protein
LPVVDVVLIEDLQETLAGRQCNIVDEGEISLKQLFAVLDVENDATLVGSSLAKKVVLPQSYRRA